MKYYVLATFFALSAPVDASDGWMSDMIKNVMKNVPKIEISPDAKKKSVTYPEDMLFLSDWNDNYSRPFQVAMVEYKLAWEAQSAAEKKRDADKVSKTTVTMENAKKKYFEAKSKLIKKLELIVQVHDWNNAEENDDEVFNYQEGTDDEGNDFQGFEIQNQNLN